MMGTLGVYMAPASICYVGWAAVGGTTIGAGSSSGGAGFGVFLLALAALTWIVSLLFLPRLIMVGITAPNPSYASVTFPTDIVAMAAIVTYKRYASDSAMMAVFCWVFMIVATFTCLSVFSWFVWQMLSGDLLRPPPIPTAPAQVEVQPVSCSPQVLQTRAEILGRQQHTCI
mmetsp:Transcript_122001/g.237241  ORF Transcript_122001/g.237241 Transcript_122001/m.237241 type:complete len:172 (-) Transcript_122001:64-579(-)